MDNNLLNQKHLRHRKPGNYDDKYSIKKAKNNTFILHACKLLKAYYDSTGITALILDAEEMRTTDALLYLGPILKKIIIVENNKDTYNKIKETIESNELTDMIEIHNCLMDKYLQNDLDTKINVVYFDLNESFFSSKVSYGSDWAINLFLSKSEVDEIVIGITFCLRSRNVGNYDLEEKKILLFLEKIFLGNGFKYTRLFMNDTRYRGQHAQNKALMFVFYFLQRYE